LPLMARDAGAQFLILNLGETGLDGEALERFNCDAGPVLSRLAALMVARVN
jgi:NAD-dependent deacetylase